ncbi:MAG: hypothetical protein RLZZ494_2007 [Pseudomonadota bacterium]|jgi:hypothetical protein
MWPVAAAMSATVAGSVAGLFTAAQAAPLCLFTSAQAGPLCLFGRAQAQEIRKASDVTVSAHRTVAGLLMDAGSLGACEPMCRAPQRDCPALPHPGDSLPDGARPSLTRRRRGDGFPGLHARKYPAHQRSQHLRPEARPPLPPLARRRTDGGRGGTWPKALRKFLTVHRKLTCRGLSHI